MAQTNLKQPRQTFNFGGSHSRSFSQPTFLANNCLPPLSPFPPTESSFGSSNSNSKDVKMEEMDVSLRGPASSRSSPMENPFRGNNGLPPRKGHRRSNSDVPLVLSGMIQSSSQPVAVGSQGISVMNKDVSENSGSDKPICLKRREADSVSNGKRFVEGVGERNLEGEVVDELFKSLLNLDQMDSLDSSSAIDREMGTVGSLKKMSGGGSINSEMVSASGHAANYNEGAKRIAVGDISPSPRHYRSLSVDSGIGNFHFGNESPNSLASQVNRVEQLSPSNSVTENSFKLNLDFGHGEFNEVELKKIIADERLAEIAVSDPKRAKRILANRQSAARSKERKVRYISELEHKVQTLQTEATTISAQITTLQKDYADLSNLNNELKVRFQAMEQQAQLRDALNEALTTEVQRLKIANMGLREDGAASNGIAQQVPVRHRVLPLQHQQANQRQQLSVTASTTSTAVSAAPTSA